MNPGTGRTAAIVMLIGGALFLSTNGRSEAAPTRGTLTPAYAVSLVQSRLGPTGMPGVRCAALRRTTCTASGDVRGSGRITGGQTWQLVSSVPRGVEPGTVGEAVFSTSKGLQAIACDPVRTRGQATVSCNGTIFGPALQGSRVIVVFGPSAHVFGNVLGPVNTDVYVANVDFNPPNDVSAIDTATHTVSATVPVGTAPHFEALNADGSRIYVTNQNSDSVSVLDGTTNVVIATIPVGNAPKGIAVNAAGTRVYVANGASGTISVIDTDAASPTVNKVIATIPLPGGEPTLSVAVTPDGKRVYATQSGDNEVAIIDAATNTVVGNIPVGINPYALAVNPTGTRLWVSCVTGLTVIDTTANTVVTTLPLGGEVAFGPDGTRAYVADGSVVDVLDTALAEQTPFPAAAIVATVPMPPANGAAVHLAYSLADNSVYVTGETTNLVTVIDADTLNVQTIQSGPAGSGAFGVAALPLPPPPGAFAYVTDDVGIEVIDTTTGQLVATVPTPTRASGIAITPDGTRAYVATSYQIRVYDTTSVVPTPIPANLPAGFEPQGVAISPDGKRVYVGDYDTGKVLVIDTATNTELPAVQIPCCSDPAALAVTPDNAFVYVLDQNTNGFSVIDTATDQLVVLPNNSTVMPFAGPTAPNGIAITPDGSRAYVATSTGVQFIDTGTNNLSPATVAAGTFFYDVAIATVPGVGIRAYASEFLNGAVAVLDGGSPPSLLPGAAAGSYPRGVAVNPLGTRLYVSNYLGGMSALGIDDPPAPVFSVTGLDTDADHVAVRP